MMKYIQPRPRYGSDCVLYLDFEQALTSTLVQDLSPYGNHSTLAGGTGTPTLAYPGASFAVANTQYINADGVVADTSSATAGTLAAWVKADNTAAWKDVVTFGDTDAVEYIVLSVADDEQLTAICYDEAAQKWYLETDSAVSTGTWIHVAVTHDGTAPVLYVDGTAVAQTFLAEDDKTVWLSDCAGIDNCRIGATFNNSTDSQYFSGSIGDVMIYKRALSAAEILSLYYLTRWRYST